MDMIKKNLLSILCGVVAIAAIVVWLWPVGSMYDSLEAELGKSKEAHTRLDDLRKASRKLPELELESGGEQPTLDRFPNDKVITVGRDKTRALTEQSNLMLTTVSDRNVHQPLVPGSLPRPLGSKGLDFAEEYLAQLGVGENGWKVGLPKLLNATHPPSPEEIEAAAQKIWDKDFNHRVYLIGGQDNYPEIAEEFTQAVQGLPEREKKKRAEEFGIYLDDDSLAISPNIIAGKQPTAAEVWYAQTALWIEEDVVAAINSANAGSKSIMQSPVKRLVAIRVPFALDQYVLPARPAGVVAAAAPVDVPTDPNGAPAAFSLSPTGRASNELYDVIHFQLILCVDYRKIPQILTELERNRLFTVLSTDVVSVDAAEERKVNGYVYGNDPVAEITLRCEALFLRSWTVGKEPASTTALMPEVVQQAIKTGGSTAPGAPGGVPGVPGMTTDMPGYRIPM